MNYQRQKVLLSASDFARIPECSELAENDPQESIRCVHAPNKSSVVVSEPFAAIFKVKKGDTHYPSDTCRSCRVSV